MLTELRLRYKTACDQIANEQLTGDAWTDYQIRRVTGDLCAERNRIGAKAWADHKFDLKAEREWRNV